MQKSQGLAETGYLVSAEVMELAKISRRTLERYVAEGKLPASKIGGFGSRRYKRSDVDALLRGELVAPSTLPAPAVDASYPQASPAGASSVSAA